MQIVDDVGPLAVLLNAGKAHRGARDETFGIVDELIEVLVAPGATLGFHGRREIKPASLTFFIADDPVQIRTDAIGAVLFEGVAGSALLGGGFTLLHRGGLQQLLDRLPGGGGGSASAP